MFDLSPIQIILVLVIALLALGPKRLPEMARSLARGLHEFRSAMTLDPGPSARQAPPAEAPPVAPAPTPAAETPAPAAAADAPAGAVAVAETAPPPPADDLSDLIVPASRPAAEPAGERAEP